MSGEPVQNKYRMPWTPHADGIHDCDDKLIILGTFLELTQHICDMASYQERCKGWNKP